MPETTTIDPSVRIVVIGAGVVGAALADELVSCGAQNVTVVDQGPLYQTGGSSTHAPGFVFQTSPSRTMSRLAQRTMDKLDGLELAGRTIVDRVGGLELASTPGQLQEIQRRYGFARAWGVPAELLDPQQTAQLWPGIDTSQILGALHTPTDGVVFSARAAEYQARRAEAGGATVLGLTRAVDVETEGTRVTGVVVEDATTGQDRRVIPAEVVVASGGIWGHPLAKLGGLRLPMHPMEHGFAWTAAAAELPGTSPEGRPLADDQAGRPIVRHQGSGLYFREFGNRIGIGAYEHRPMPLAPEHLTDTAHLLGTGQEPAKRGFTPEDFEYCRSEVARVLPAIKDLPLEDAFNGVFSFTPDGGPMLGPSRHLEGFWAAQAIWVTQSAGCAEVVAQWILTGDPGIDTHELDLNRFDPALLSDEWIRGRAAENYDEVYDVHFPHQSTVIARGLKTSPFHPRIQDAGGVFTEANGWERPLWHAQNAALLNDPEFGARTGESVVPVAVPRRDAWDQVNWSPIAAAEAWATRNRVAVYDMTSLTRYRVRGAGVTQWLESLNSNRIAKSIGAVTYSLMLDEAGGILSDITVTRTGEEEYFIGANGPLDLDRLTRLLPDSGNISIDDITTSTCCLGLWGPRAREVIAPITEGDISNEGLKYFRSARIRISGVPVLALRVSYVGELGWELYTEAAHGLRLWDQIMAQGAAYGIVPAGRAAFNSLRLEKGYRAWGADMTREDTPEDSGLGFAVRLEKEGGFAGRQALTEHPSKGRRLVTFGMRLDSGRPDSGAPVFDAAGGQDPVGWVTSADFGYVTGQIIGLAWVSGELAEPGTALGIMRFGHVLKAEVLAEPVYDPEMSRIRR